MLSVRVVLISTVSSLTDYIFAIAVVPISPDAVDDCDIKVCVIRAFSAKQQSFSAPNYMPLITVESTSGAIRDCERIKATSARVAKISSHIVVYVNVFVSIRIGARSVSATDYSLVITVVYLLVWLVVFLSSEALAAGFGRYLGLRIVFLIRLRESEIIIRTGSYLIASLVSQDDRFGSYCICCVICVLGRSGRRLGPCQYVEKGKRRVHIEYD